MVRGKESVILKENISFETVLDTACYHLREKQIQYSIRRIDEMENELAGLQKELDDFIGRKPAAKERPDHE